MDRKLIILKLISILTFFAMTQLCLAETCPSVQDIKQNNMKGWKIFDSEEGIPLSERREADFRNHIVAFAMAEWVKSNKNGIIHCYYKNKDGSDMEAFLTKDNFIPSNAQNLWYQVSGSWQCAASALKCEFKSLNREPHLARR